MISWAASWLGQRAGQGARVLKLQRGRPRQIKGISNKLKRFIKFQQNIEYSSSFKRLKIQRIFTENDIHEEIHLGFTYTLYLPLFYYEIV